MNDLEATFWRAEVDPALYSHGVVLDVLDTTPEWERLHRAHEWAVRLIPRLRQRVVDDPVHLGPPAWVSTEVDLSYHLLRATAADFAEVIRHAETLHMDPFDRGRPLWRAVLVEGLADGRSYYLFKVHHSVADGTGIVQLFDLLHSHTAAPTPDKEMPDPVAADPLRGRDLLPGRAFSLASALPGAGISLVRKAVSTSPVEAVAYAQSLGRVTTPPGTPSPLFRGRGLGRSLRALEVPLASLRAAGKSAGGTVNDAYLAGLLGGLRLYHEQHGATIGDVPLALPVSMRTADIIGGNHFAAATIAGPAGEADPAARIKLLHDRVQEVRTEPALDFMGAVAPVASRLPSQVLAKVAKKISSGLDLQASNIPGLNRESYLAGARIERMFVFGPVPGCAIMATMLTHEGIGCIGVASDDSAVPDPDVLASCFEAGIAEVVDS